MQEMRELAQVFTDITDVKTMESFFEEIFTEAERKDLALRWQLMKMLNQKKPQREIASLLRISLCKITRGAKIVKDPESVSRQFLDKSK